MIEALLFSLAVSLGLTVALEAGFFLLIGKRGKKDLLLLVLVNVLTNPIVVLSFWLVSLYTNWNIYIALILLEAFAVLTEGFYYKKYGNAFTRPFLFSLSANMVSFGAGALIQYLFL